MKKNDLITSIEKQRADIYDLLYTLMLVDSVEDLIEKITISLIEESKKEDKNEYLSRYL